MGRPRWRTRMRPSSRSSGTVHSRSNSIVEQTGARWGYLSALRRLLGALCVALVALTFSSTSAQARVSADDAATTHAYLEATIAMSRASAAEQPAFIRELATFETQVKASCPGILSGVPTHNDGESSNESAFQIGQELTFVTLGGAERVEHPLLARYAAVVRHLRWSNRKLTKLLRSLAREQGVQSAIALPDLCSDLRFWVASGYKAVSQQTTALLRRLQVVSSITLIENEPHEPVTNFLDTEALVAYRLKPYENRADQPPPQK